MSISWILMSQNFKYVGLGNFPFVLCSIQNSAICICSVAFSFIVVVATGLFTVQQIRDWATFDVLAGVTLCYIIAR